jgi:hypothetical protein
MERCHAMGLDRERPHHRDEPCGRAEPHEVHHAMRTSPGVVGNARTPVGAGRASIPSGIRPSASVRPGSTRVDVGPVGAPREPNDGSAFSPDATDCSLVVANPEFGWLSDGEDATVRAALANLVPALATATFERSPRPAGSDPRWWQSNAIVGGDHVVKFAWSEPAAARLHREILVLEALGRGSVELAVPRVAFSSSDPTLLGTYRLEGAVVPHQHLHRLGTATVELAAGELAEFLAALHAPGVLEHVRAEGVRLGRAEPQGSTPVLRDRSLRSSPVTADGRLLFGVTGSTKYLPRRGVSASSTAIFTSTTCSGTPSRCAWSPSLTSRPPQ